MNATTDATETPETVPMSRYPGEVVVVREGSDSEEHHPDLWDFPDKGFKLAVCNSCPYVAVVLERPPLTVIDGGAE